MSTPPTVIVDASWQESWSGAGLVLTLDGSSTARAYAYRSGSSLEAELFGIHLAIGWLMEIRRGPGTVYSDSEGAIKQRRLMDSHGHGVKWLRKETRDVRYQRAHQAGFVAREMAKRLQDAPLGPLPVPLEMSPVPKHDPPPAVATAPPSLPRPRPPTPIKFGVTVVIDGVRDLHDFARMLAAIPGDALPVLFGQFLHGDQAMFGTRLTEDECRRLAEAFDQLGRRASLYVRDADQSQTA